MFPIKWELNEKRGKPFCEIPYDFIKKIYDHIWENLESTVSSTHKHKDNTLLISPPLIPFYGLI